MLDLVDLGKRSFSAYRGIAPDERLMDALAHQRPLAPRALALASQPGASP
jgi:hypothetical protein